MSRKPKTRVYQVLGLLAACGCGSFGAHPPVKLAFTIQPTGAFTGVAMSPVAVTVQDDFGNTVSGASMNITVAIGTNPGSGTLSGTTTVAAVRGVAIFSNLMLDTSGAGYTLTASANGFTGATTSPFDVAQDALVFTIQPTRAFTGQAISTIAVAVRAADGTTVSSASMNVTVALGNNPDGGNLSGTTTVPATGGVAIFSDLSLDKAGVGYTLTASANGVLRATSSPFDVAQDALVFTIQPTETLTNTAIRPVVVTVQAADGTTISTANMNVTVAIGTNPDGGTLSGTTTVPAVRGVAIFSDLSLDKPGVGYTLTANANRVVGATSSPFDVVQGKLAFTLQPSDPTVVGHAISPAVQVAVQDQLGNTVTGANTKVTITLGTTQGQPAASGTLSGTATVAAVNGIASFSDLSITTVSPPGYTLIASADGLSSVISSPFRVITPLVFAGVSAGGSHTCGVGGGTYSGYAFCWGDATWGELGDCTTVVVGTTRTSAIPLPVRPYSGLPYPTFASVSAGDVDSIGLTTSGEAYLWGRGSNGNGSSLQNCVSSENPVPWAGTGTAAIFAAISAGVLHTCGITPAGTAYCMGGNASGQLGDGTTTDRDWLEAVLGGLTFAAVSAGASHTCGVTTGGAAFCWGDNTFGQLGDGTMTGRTSPVAVLGGLTFAAISAGESHSCAVTSAGAAYCWGDNTSGQLGDGTMTSRTSPVAVLGGFTFAAVSAGGAHTCGVTSAGAAYCWGDNTSGQLGDGTMTSRTSPVEVLGGLTFAAVSAGGLHTCGITPAGAAYCWGDNTSGQLGDATSTASSVPVKVAMQ
jgi:alpha-tubulin suppressor-like RCC1 family protein